MLPTFYCSDKLINHSSNSFSLEGLVKESVKHYHAGQAEPHAVYYCLAQDEKLLCLACLHFPFPTEQQKVKAKDKQPLSIAPAQVVCHMWQTVMPNYLCFVQLCLDKPRPGSDLSSNSGLNVVIFTAPILNVESRSWQQSLSPALNKVEGGVK